MKATSTARRTRGAEESSALEKVVHRFSVTEYHRMIADGILTTNNRVELLDGRIIDKMPQTPAHSSTIVYLQRLLTEVLPKECVVRSQLPSTLAASEPEPDFTIVRGPEEGYLRRHPGPDDSLWVIEVANESLKIDRKEKGAIYARAQLPQYWIVNLADKVIEVYTKPRPGKHRSYRQLKEYDREDDVPLKIDGVLLTSIPVRDIIR